MPVILALQVLTTEILSAKHFLYNIAVPPYGLPATKLEEVSTADIPTP